MADDGRRRALAIVLSAYSSYSSCRQYLEDIERARTEVGERAPAVDKVRAFYNHPGFVNAQADRIRSALAELPEDRRERAPLIYTAHSIPDAMAEGCRYEAQLTEACRLVSDDLGRGSWRLVYQSRSGPPTQPWLAPDVCDFLRELYAQQQPQDVVIAPIGFLSDHMEVIYDLDTVARDVCRELGMNMVRAGTVGNHPEVVRMLRLLIEERLAATNPRLALGQDGPARDACPDDCCPSGRK
jgi:ferrochelatase